MSPWWRTLLLAVAAGVVLGLLSAGLAYELLNKLTGN